MTDADRRAGIARENVLQWALHMAATGEDPMSILARAQLYEEYILAAKATGLVLTQDHKVPVDGR